MSTLVDCSCTALLLWSALKHSMEMVICYLIADGVREDDSSSSLDIGFAADDRSNFCERRGAHRLLNLTNKTVIER